MIDGERCCGCGGRFPVAGGTTHPYMLASPGCWSAYGEVLACEYQDGALFTACHRLTVDAYALQHPGVAGDRRAVQSVWLHFASLEAVFGRGCSHAGATGVMKRLAGRAFPPLPPAPAHAITVADLTATDPRAHVAWTERWARAAYGSWAPSLRPMLDRIIA